MTLSRTPHIVWSFFIAILLSLLPTPAWALWLHPAWVLLIFIYWAINVPFSVSVGAAWLLGLLIDVLSGTFLGEHALAFSIIAFLTLRTYRQLRVFPMWQQTLCVTALVFVYQVILFLLQGIIGSLITIPQFWLTPFTTLFLWPLITVTLRNVSFRK